MLRKYVVPSYRPKTLNFFRFTHERSFKDEFRMFFKCLSPLNFSPFEDFVGYSPSQLTC